MNETVIMQQHHRQMLALAATLGFII